MSRVTITHKAVYDTLVYISHHCAAQLMIERKKRLQVQRKTTQAAS